jgi:hypothetical protein
VTATIEDQDVAGILTRADARYARRTSDDPAPDDYIRALASAVRTQLGGLASGGEAPADDATVRHLRADNERLSEVTADVQRLADDRSRTIDRLQRELKAAPKPDALAELKADNSDLANQLAVARTDAESWHSEHDRVKAELEASVEALTEQLAKLRTAAERTLEEITAADADHKHQYESPGPGLVPLPCECGQPYPRGRRPPIPAGKPDRDPWGDLFGRIRTELDGWAA